MQIIDFLNQLAPIRAGRDRRFRKRMINKMTKLGHAIADGVGQWVSLPGLNGKLVYEVRSAEEGWKIVERGSRIPLRLFANKKDAIKEARKMARDHKAPLEVFTRNGIVQTTQSHFRN